MFSESRFCRRWNHLIIFYSVKLKLVFNQNVCVYSHCKAPVRRFDIWRCLFMIFRVFSLLDACVSGLQDGSFSCGWDEVSSWSNPRFSEPLSTWEGLLFHVTLLLPADAAKRDDSRGSKRVTVMKKKKPLRTFQTDVSITSWRGRRLFTVVSCVYEVKHRWDQRTLLFPTSINKSIHSTWETRLQLPEM